jgi:TIR domain
MADVYIAYSHHDRTEARAMAIALEKWGYTIWWDDKILPGADWTLETRNNSRETKCLLALLSTSFFASKFLEVYCRIAASRGILVPVLIQDNLSLDGVPFIPRGTQILDVSKWRLTRDADNLASLLSVVSKLVGRRPERSETSRRVEFRAVRLSIPGNQREGNDVFVSYKKDDRKVVFEFIKIFRDFGFSAWWDEMIPAGRNWGYEIDQALMRSRCVVVFWTPKSVLSQEVYSEAEYGMQKGAYFPILLERCQVPPRMSRAQWVDVTQGQPLENEKFHLLIEQLKNKVE